MKRVHTYDGVVGLRSIANHLSINFNTLEHRARRMCIEDAILACGIRDKKVYEYNGIVGIKNISDSIGVSSNTMKARLKKMTLDEAVNFDPVKARKERDLKRREKSVTDSKKKIKKLPTPEISKSSRERAIDLVFR